MNTINMDPGGFQAEHEREERKVNRRISALFALNGLIAREPTPNFDSRNLCWRAFQIADQFLEQEEKPVG